MGNINHSFYNRVKYTLQNNSNSYSIVEPEGWNDDEKEYARNEDYHGIFAKFSNALKFVGRSADLINEIIATNGIQTNLRLIKEERHPQNDIWIKIYDGYLDLSTWSEENNVVSLKFNSGGLEEIIKSRENEEVELDRLTSIDGDTILPITNENITFQGRKIFLKSKWETKLDENEDEVSVTVFSDDGNTRSQTTGYPLEKLVYKSHEEAQAVNSNSFGDHTGATIGCMFFAVAERDKTLKVIGQDIKFKTLVPRSEYDWAEFRFSLTTYDNDQHVKNRINLVHIGEGSSYDGNFTNVQNKLHEINFNHTINLLKGESLALEVYLKSDLLNFNNPLDGGARVTVKLVNREGLLLVDEDSSFEPTNCKFFLPHEAADRLVQIITGKQNIFKSNFLGRTDCEDSLGNNIGYTENGPGAFNGLTHGFWIRGFDKLPLSTEEDPNNFKPFTTSFKNLVDSFDAIHSIGLGIEKDGYNEKVIVEDLRYFYDRNVTIKLPNQIKKEKRSISTKHYFSGVEIGYEKGGNYEEAFGLDEYNAKSNFTTFIKVIKQKFTKISNFRADSYGKEFCRRKQIKTHSTQDTPYDEDVFIMDLKKLANGTFKERIWQDDFAQQPTGIYSPETATNLRFSPFNMLLRHGWEIMAGLVKYPTEYVTYSSSNANSKLSTKLTGGNEYFENGRIVNSELQKARYIADVVEFDHVVDFDINQKLQGYTMVNGEKIYNVYGLIEFTNKKGKIERGWLLNLKPNKEGKWKLLIQNR